MRLTCCSPTPAALALPPPALPISQWQHHRIGLPPVLYHCLMVRTFFSHPGPPTATQPNLSPPVPSQMGMSWTTQVKAARHRQHHLSNKRSVAPSQRLCRLQGRLCGLRVTLQGCSRHHC